MSPAIAETPKDTGEKKFEPSNVTKARQEIMDAIQHHDTVVINAGTGSGKSLFGPVHLLEGMQQQHPGKHIKMLIGEPRRFLAVSNAEKVAKIQKVPLGGALVGYHHGEADKKTDETQLLYTVNGSIRNMLQKDITLEGYDAVFLDEIHLREIDQYAIRMGLKECQRKRAEVGMPPLKVIIASADATARDGEYHGNSQYLEIPGTKPHNVDKYFADKSTSLADTPKEMARIAARIIKDKKNYGDVLGFLPGRAEILEATTEFNRIMKEEGLADTYKSGMFTGGGGKENDEIQALLTAGIEGRHPMFVAGSDVAETGANFPIRKVIDCPWARIPIYDPIAGITRLVTVPSAFANHKQRLGRVGREVDGEFHAMYSEEEMNNTSIHPAEQQASIMKSDLTPLILSLKTMGLIDVYDLDYPDRPGDHMIDHAVKTLSMLDALKPDGSLSDEGKVIARLPMDARFGKMFVEAQRNGCTEAMGALYGFMNSMRSVFSRLEKPTDKLRDKYPSLSVDSDSDYITLLHVWNEYVGEKQKGGDIQKWAQEQGYNYDVLKEVDKAKIDLVESKYLREAGLGSEHKIIDIKGQKQAVMGAVLSGFADKLLQHDDPITFSFVDGERKGILAQSSTGIISTTPYMISGEFRGGKTPDAPLYAGMNQVVTQQQYDVIEAKLTKINEKIAAEAEKRGERQTAEPQAAIEEAERIFNEHKNEGEAAAAAAAEIMNAHKRETEEKIAETRAELHHEQHHDADDHASHDDQVSDHGGSGETSHGTTASLWQEFTTNMRKIGRGITWPVRKLWELFTNLFGSGKRHVPSSHESSGGGHH